jgi:pantoate--beta-alanine ligase
LQAARERIARGERSAEVVKATALEQLSQQPLLRVEYVEVAGLADMRPVHVIDGPVCVAAAVWLGRTRLIDNVQA